jgi:hypothetical protein
VKAEPGNDPRDEGYLSDVVARCPYGKPGDLLWVREGFAYYGMKADHVFYRATDCGNLNWRPSIHMPRWASRLTLEITDVRVERLQEINHADAMAEGVSHEIDLRPLVKLSSDEFATAHSKAVNDATREAYKELWNSINGAGAWEKKPWVWALTFRVHHCNVDEFIKQKAA